MKRLILTICFSAISLVMLLGQTDQDIFTIYLIRHAEKQITSSDPSDPGLSEFGTFRAGHIAMMLQDIPLKGIYSTNYLRTKATASPTASMKGLETAIYDPRDLREFSQQLLLAREDVLVVGHSNTTSVLAGLLAGQDLKQLNDTIYDRIYQVIVFNDTAIINIINQGLILTR